MLLDKSRRPCLYIRELAMTLRCDAVHDFSRIRQSYETHLGADAMQRIASFKETQEDEHIAADAVARNITLTKRHAQGGLTWHTWVGLCLVT